MKIILNLNEYYDIKRAIQFSKDALLSGGDFEQRRFGENKYDWQLVNDALHVLEEAEEHLK